MPVSQLAPSVSTTEAWSLALTHEAVCSVSAGNNALLSHSCTDRCKGFLTLFRKLTPVEPMPSSMPSSLPSYKGGGRAKTLVPPEVLLPYVVPHPCTVSDLKGGSACAFISHGQAALTIPSTKSSVVVSAAPPSAILPFLTLTNARKIARYHDIPNAYKLTLPVIQQHFANHHCPKCVSAVTTFSYDELSPPPPRTNINPPIIPNGSTSDRIPPVNIHSSAPVSQATFPPEPVDDNLTDTILRSACDKLRPEVFEEAGCAVCGQLTQRNALSKIRKIKNLLRVLEATGVTRKERTSSSEPAVERDGPVYDDRCTRVCALCRASLSKGCVPKNALSTGLWLGEVPPVLKNLRFMERLLIARIRHTAVYVKVGKHGRKMTANAVAFEAPTPRLYSLLPPPREDVEEILAVLFTGPSPPTEADFARTPLLIRRNAVKLALEWLILNHSDYSDVAISSTNLMQYDEKSPPCSVVWQESDSNKTRESTAVNDLECGDGVEEGCTFTVHGLTDEQLIRLSEDQIKGYAAQHFTSGGRLLTVGHNSTPESIWKNPALYPKMFPWLFPYGMGGLGTALLSENEHKKWLLLYHDKRFQTDKTFPIVAFSHQQVKAATQSGWLLADKRSFSSVADRIMQLDQRVLENIASRMQKGEKVVPQTPSETACFQVLSDLDRVAGKVPGSTTTKKFMRNEVWSLIVHKGAPSWYITIAPADEFHPLAIYYADTDECFTPTIKEYTKRAKLIGSNPVACARFFNYVVKIFLEDVLGYNSAHRGLYGEHDAHYGVVEQQGRLTLHLHLLLWIKNALKPEELRQKILDGNEVFQRKLIAYLESVFSGDFIDAEHEQVKADADIAEKEESYQPPSEVLPEGPLLRCKLHHASRPDMTCKICRGYLTWKKKYVSTVNELLLRCNYHDCKRYLKKDGTRKKRHLYKGCRDNRWGKCRARFPRPCYKLTTLDPLTGAVTMKKREPNFNTFTYPLTYILRCNTDVTFLGSGTAIKSVVLYVTDYITKASLKTHVVFDSIVSVFAKNKSLVTGSLDSQERARQFLTKVVNVLSTKMEFGAPLICSYLLGYPDHYTDHTYIPFYWQQYVTHVRGDCHPNEQPSKPQKVALMKRGNRVIGLSPVTDYKDRPAETAEWSLYDWVRLAKRVSIRHGKTKSKRNAASKEDCESDTGVEDQVTEHESPKLKVTLRKNQFRFMSSHDLANTHVAQISRDSDKVVVNFTGASLPRRDQGDYEYYCCTMLTLFKPWRNGNDLKPADQTWAQAFEAFSFSDRQKKLMDNMMIRYECLDARDDYRAQMKKGNHLASSWDPALDELSDDEDCVPPALNDEICPGLPDTDIIDNLLAEVQDKSQKARSADMLKADMLRILSVAGLMEPDKSVSSAADAPDISQLPTLPRDHWKSLLMEKRDEVINSRTNTVPASVRTEFFERTKLKSELKGQVHVIDQSYLQNTFNAGDHQSYIDQTLKVFSLNKEQERAFRIIANHAASPVPDQLKMHVGGMGGTGKSTVLKALIYYFALRKEEYRLLVVAPTGSAAALLGGSTYHSAFGINDRTSQESSLPNVRERLMGVQYIFFDEVSMLSAWDLYRISRQLCLALLRDEIPFGGLNMIFAGDFAQLPPPLGKDSVSLYGRRIGAFTSTPRQQEEAIGKSLWHHVTTVVILRQNMRQRTQSPEDAKFRTALENMRYKNCTPADIAFLNSRVHSPVPGGPSMRHKRFRNVAIITARNAQKDFINSVGCERFAAETGQQLTHFYSDDELRVATERQLSSNSKLLKLNCLTVAWKNLIWSLDPSACDTLTASKLSLCKGMPIMIRRNLATELNITRGQEGTVVGWISRGPSSRLHLDTLFVKLTNPPSPVNIPGLPENVVPLTPSSEEAKITFPSGNYINVTRSQVDVLPCFAMTDYASQGKTRPDNVVHLNNCADFHGYYTALSRSSCAAGTLIIQSFDPKKIQGGLRGNALRQEYRELELLDDITTRRFECTLPSKVCGTTRNALINSFRDYVGHSYVPPNVYKTIRWSPSDPLEAVDVGEVAWQIVSRQKQKVNGQAKASDQAKVLNDQAKPSLPLSEKKSPPNRLPKPALPLRMPTKQKPRVKRDLSSLAVPSTSKRARIVSPISITRTPRTLPAPVWSNNSCAYDAVLSIVHSIWAEDPVRWSEIFRQSGNEIQYTLATMFEKCRTGMMDISAIRDRLRELLALSQPTDFCIGTYASAWDILTAIFRIEMMGSVRLHTCNTCAFQRQDVTPPPLSLIDQGQNETLSTAALIRCYTSPEEYTRSAHSCFSCGTRLNSHVVYNDHPPLIGVHIRHNASTGVLPYIDTELTIPVQDGSVRYRLSGVVYYGNSHFVSRSVDVDSDVWYHDGMAEGTQRGVYVWNGNFGLRSLDLASTRGYTATAVVYQIL